MSRPTSVFRAAVTLLKRASRDDWTNDSVNRPGPDGERIREALRPGQPCEGLSIDIDIGLARSGVFELRNLWNEGRTLVVEAEWTPNDGTRVSPASLRADFFVAIGDVVGAQTFVDEQVGESSMDFDVITGGPGHGHLLSFHIIGEAAREVVSYRRGLKISTGKVEPPERS